LDNVELGGVELDDVVAVCYLNGVIYAYTERKIISFVDADSRQFRNSTAYDAITGIDVTGCVRAICGVSCTVTIVSNQA
jgi:hypothetical protein